MTDPAPTEKSRCAVPEWVDGQVLGMTPSGKSFTTWRWWNELFKLLVIREKTNPSTLDLYTHPAHLFTDRYESPVFDGGHIWVTYRIDSQAFRDWLGNLESKGYIESNTNGDETVWSLTNQAEKILSHLMGTSKHKFQDGVCTVCYARNFVDFDEDLERLIELVENPKDNPAKEKRKQALKNELDEAELVELLRPSEDSVAMRLYDIRKWLEENHQGWEDRSYQERNAALGDKLDSLMEKGEICKSERLGGYTWPSFNIQFVNGEINSIQINEDSSSFIERLMPRR